MVILKAYKFMTHELGLTSPNMSHELIGLKYNHQEPHACTKVEIPKVSTTRTSRFNTQPSRDCTKENT